MQNNAPAPLADSTRAIVINTAVLPNNIDVQKMLSINRKIDSQDAVKLKIKRFFTVVQILLGVGIIAASVIGLVQYQRDSRKQKVNQVDKNVETDAHARQKESAAMKSTVDLLTEDCARMEQKLKAEHEDFDRDQARIASIDAQLADNSLSSDYRLHLANSKAERQNSANGTQANIERIEELLSKKKVTLDLNRQAMEGHTLPSPQSTASPTASPSPSPQPIQTPLPKTPVRAI